MDAAGLARFEPFAKAFVWKYWETVHSGAFPMPPYEPVEETIEELLSEISHQTAVIPPSARGGPSYSLRLISSHGSWWLFSFRDGGQAWELIGALARSDTQTPHDLLDPVYFRYFEPFLRHVEKLANDANSI